MDRETYEAWFPYRNSSLAPRERIKAVCSALDTGDDKTWKSGGGWFSGAPTVKAVRSNHFNSTRYSAECSLDVYVDDMLVYGGFGTSVTPERLGEDQEERLLERLLAMFDGDLSKYEKKRIKDREAQEAADVHRKTKIGRLFR